MAKIDTLPGIRYADGADLAAVVTPPYDVITPEAQARYYARDPHNIIRLELGREEPGDDDLKNQYTRAAQMFAEWRLHGVMRQDAPSLYLYEQRFAVAGATYRRASLLARVRLEPWEARVILPHERTHRKAKEDRLRLMRACAANLSPIMALYDDPAGELAATLTTARETLPVADFEDEAGEGHRLWALRDDALLLAIADFFGPRQLYIADGHHRYETALTYRDEVAALRKEQPLDPGDAANFTLMALAAIEDPNLVVLPTHRILRDLDPTRVDGLKAALAEHFIVESLDPATSAEALLAALDVAERQGERCAFVFALPGKRLLLRLRPEGRAAMRELTGANADRSRAWRSLDLAVLHELVFARALGVTDDAVQAGEYVTYTRDPHEALAAVDAATDGAQLAALVAPTPPSAIREVALAGDRMPQKSTYFYPKLITGLVVNPLW